MAKRNGNPSFGELVICKVKKINPNSAELSLLEYPREGMVHISEIASGWINKIRDHIKIGDIVVAKVFRINDRDRLIGLTIKRVDKSQEKEKIKEFNLDKKGEKMLEMAGKMLKKNLSTSYKEVGHMLQDNFGYLFKAFKKSMTDDKILESRGIPSKWVSAIRKIAIENIELKDFDFTSKVSIQCMESDGVELIKKLLINTEKKGLEIKYISAPEYMLKYSSKDAKKGEKEFNTMIEKLKSDGKPKIFVEVLK